MNKREYLQIRSDIKEFLSICTIQNGSRYGSSEIPASKRGLKPCARLPSPCLILRIWVSDPLNAAMLKANGFEAHVSITAQPVR